MKVNNSTLIDEVKKLEKKNLETKRYLALDNDKVSESANSVQQKKKKMQDTQDHLIIPQIQVFG